MTMDRRPHVIGPEMLEWPGTPGRERLLRARDLLEERTGKFIETAGLGPWQPDEREDSARAIADLPHATIVEENVAFGLWAIRFFGETIDGSTDPEVRLAAMSEAARQGCCTYAIGLAASGRHDPVSRRTAFGFARLPRDPDWMGLVPMLEMTRGSVVLVRGAMDAPDRPAIAVCLPTFGTLWTPMPFPPGEAQQLKRVLEFHGALPVWRPPAPRERNLIFHEDTPEDAPEGPAPEG